MTWKLKILPEIKGAPIWAKLVFVVLNKFILRLCSSLNLYLNKSATSFFVSGLCKKLSGPKLYFWDETLNPLSEMYPPLPCIDSGKSLVAYVELLKEQTEFPFFHLQLPINYIEKYFFNYFFIKFYLCFWSGLIMNNNSI